MIGKKKFLLVVSTVLCNSFVAASFCDWKPIIYNSIKWTAADQGVLTITYTTEHGITRVPIAYHGGVDTNASGEITDKNISHFTEWADETLPTNYCGPVVLDYEEPWWKELQAKTILPDRLREILGVYSEGIRVAHNIRPSSQWGYWGLPLLRNTSESWTDQGLSLEPLISSCNALYPDVYNCTPGLDRSRQAEQHISNVLQLAAGRMPVFVFASVRYCGPDVGHSDFVPDEIFLKQVNAALRASWIDEFGNQHRIKGIILWDNYGFSQESEWGSLDQKHKYYFELLEALSEAWEKSMKGKKVIVGPPKPEVCQYGLSEPANSGETIFIRANREHPQEMKEVIQENTRVPSGRVGGNRVTE